MNRKVIIIYILHCISKNNWETLVARGEALSPGAGEAFIHCSSIDYFWRVAPNFTGAAGPLLLLVIDPDRLEAKVLWEDGDGCGRAYPHVYGTIPPEAVIQVLPFLTDDAGNYRKNPEFAAVADR